MTTNADALERALRDDLARLGDDFVDDQSSADLYRALTNNRWGKRDGPDGRVSLSWSRAAELVNELRRERGRDPLDLAQSGGEGEVSRTIGEELGRLGWNASPLNTSRHDEAHVASAESPPPADTGERLSPTEDSHAWERQAHEEAEQERTGAAPGPGAGGPGAGGEGA